MRALTTFVLALCCGCAAEGGAGEASGGAGGGVGGAGGGTGGAPGCVDHAAASACRVELEGLAGGCDYGEVCALRQQSCPDGAACCTLPLACAAPIGGRPGGGRCEQDGDCASGLCLQARSGVKLCHRVCEPADGTGCPDGMHCARVELTPGVETTTCFGGTVAEADPDATVCRADGECVAGRRCRLQVPAGGVFEAVPLGVCTPRDEGTPVDDGARCGVATPGHDATAPGSFEASLGCVEHGLCLRQCRAEDAAVCACLGAQEVDGTCAANRCVRPCRMDADCPAREVCGAYGWGREEFTSSEHALRVCQLPVDGAPQWGCRDELDCCRDGVQSDGRPCCDQKGMDEGCIGPVETLTTCRVEQTPDDGRLLTLCRPTAAALQLPGAPCVGEADCAGGVCVPDGVGGKLCSSPCDPAHDRCEQILPGSSCRAAALEAGGCLQACRFEAAGEAPCVP